MLCCYVRAELWHIVAHHVALGADTAQVNDDGRLTPNVRVAL